LTFYRYFQLSQCLANDLVSFILPTILPGAEALMIATAYTIIRLHRKLDVSLVLGLTLLGIISIVIQGISIKLAVRVTEISKTFVDVVRRIEIKYQKHDQLYINSCRPLRWTIGGTLTLKKETFPQIVDVIIINILINLLVTF